MRLAGRQAMAQAAARHAQVVRHARVGVQVLAHSRHHVPHAQLACVVRCGQGLGLRVVVWCGVTWCGLVCGE
jgi:hypothetical protein